MNIVFRTSNDLIIGEFKTITAHYENGKITISFRDNDNDNIDITIHCDTDKVSRILDKVYIDFKRGDICILDNDMLSRL